MRLLGIEKPSLCAGDGGNVEGVSSQLSMILHFYQWLANTASSGPCYHLNASNYFLTAGLSELLAPMKISQGIASPTHQSLWNACCRHTKTLWTACHQQIAACH